ncbi:unnamed protein product [Orchesella dallaii]|uniref:Uncharacterized protein n=1 Tax=Orchesella dallaii TaxID=48710 RepID=A0ABP1PKB6_9HEXA
MYQSYHSSSKETHEVFSNLVMISSAIYTLYEMPVKLVEVEGFENFMTTVREQEAEALTKNIPLIVIIKSSNQPNGKSWCHDCVLRTKNKSYTPKLTPILEASVH